jgi:drug/metabolite transporter (DMT)-like permease
LIVIASASLPRLVSRSMRWRPGDAVLAAVAGALGAAANASFLLATRSGLLGVVSVIASLYPAITVVLARGVLREPITRIQLGGLTLAVVGITLIATG